jgi:transposase
MNLGIKELIDAMLPILNERQRRLFLAKQAAILGYGGITEVSNYTGFSRQTITNGIKELSEDTDNFADTNRSGRAGGGRKNIREHYPEMVQVIAGLVEGHTKGNPENSLLWTSKSIRNIQAALDAQGIKVSHTRIGEILKEAGYSLQANRKELAKNICHADRDAQARVYKPENEKGHEEGDSGIVNRREKEGKHRKIQEWGQRIRGERQRGVSV